MEITKSKLHALAAIGARLEVEDIERRLTLYQREWPELFVSSTPPTLLKQAAPLHWVEVPRNGNGNGHVKTHAWTPERRARQAATIRARNKKRKKDA